MRKKTRALLIVTAFLCVFSPGNAVRVFADQGDAARAALTEKDAAGEAAAALKRSVASLKLQTEIPSGQELMPPTPGKNSPLSSLNFSPSMARWLFWTSVLAVVLVVVFNVNGNLWSFSRSRRLSREENAAAPSAGAAARMVQARSEAEVLARNASYAEAMHVLLLQSVNELRLRLDTPISAALTSREILLGLGLSARLRENFADIVGRVEISYFGPHEPAEEDYLACRKSFEALTRELRQERAA